MRKKAQQEIVGFMIIILIVVIIGVIFLGIFLRKSPGVITDDAEISNFLISSGKYTSQCYKDYEPNYRSLEELAADCYANKDCGNGESSCDELKKEYGEMLSRLWTAGENRPIKYYKLAFSYEENLNETNGKEFLQIKEGNVSYCKYNRRMGSNTINSASGDISIELEVCKA
jgi:hypothetical protein